MTKQGSVYKKTYSNVIITCKKMEIIHKSFKIQGKKPNKEPQGTKQSTFTAEDFNSSLLLIEIDSEIQKVCTTELKYPTGSK